MDDNIIIGVGLAKNVFQLHGTSRDGTLKTQSPPAKDWSQNIRPDFRRARQNL